MKSFVCSSGCSGAEREPESRGFKRNWNVAFKARCVCFLKKKNKKTKQKPQNIYHSQKPPPPFFVLLKLSGSNSESFILLGRALKFQVAIGKRHDSGKFRVGCVNYQVTSSSVIIPNCFIWFSVAHREEHLSTHQEITKSYPITPEHKVYNYLMCQIYISTYANLLQSCRRCCHFSLNHSCQ